MGRPIFRIACYASGGTINYGDSMRRIIHIAVLIIAGEMIFSLPFHTARFFRPTLLDVFGFSNTNLGDMFAVYGITAMLAYFPGGVIADRYSARKLLTLSMVLTGLGGFYMATIPSGISMALLYGYWGVTSILLFWAAVLKSTREWGGDLSQGRAFGILEGGRGLVAAAFAVFAVAVMASMLPTDVVSASDAEQRTAFRNVILLYSATTVAIGLLTWFFLPEPEATSSSSTLAGSMNGAFTALSRPIVWAKAGVVICAYCGYKGLDNISLYAVQVLGMNEVEGARLFAYAAYMRPVAAVAAGVLADRFVASKTIAVIFVVLTSSFGMLSIAMPTPGWLAIIYVNIYVSVIGNTNTAAYYRDHCRRHVICGLHAGNIFCANRWSNPGRSTRNPRSPELFPVPCSALVARARRRLWPDADQQAINISGRHHAELIPGAAYDPLQARKCYGCTHNKQKE
jgi:predicted MFS family arabinose efflux permease